MSRIAKLLETIPTDLFINGEFRPSSSKERFDVLNPATGEVLTSVASATPEDAAEAMDIAVAAQEAWAATPPRTRSDILYKAFELATTTYRDDLALIMTLEMGKPLDQAAGEVAYGASFLRWFAEEATRIRGDYFRIPEGHLQAIVVRRPVGPCLFITPWNFPLAMATRKAGPAFAAGNVAILKPSKETPLTALFFAKIMHEAGLPAGVLSVIPSKSSRTITGPIIADSRLRKLSFTGSTAVGKALLKEAAANVLRTSMELGGNAPFIVFDDADLDKAVDGAIAAKFRNIGQACTAANRFIVHRDVAEEFARRVTERVTGFTVGRGTEEGVTIGPLINDAAVSKAGSLVRDAVERGATLLTGGEAVEGPGTFYQPTVVSDVRPGSEILREEIFGPVLAIVPFETEDEAVSIANDTDFGLVSYVYTENIGRGQRMLERLETGMMGLNVGVVSNAAAPFGGWKLSGLGREGGVEGIHEYLQSKYTLTPDPF